MSYMIWVWLAAIVIFIVVEALTAGLVSIWFVAGSLAAAIAAVADGSIAVQLVLFAVVSALALAVTRPLVKKFRGRAVATNADRVLGESARVTETVDNERSTGAVYVDGKTWSARSGSGDVIPVGAVVKIERMEGVKLFVKNTENKMEAVK